MANMKNPGALAGASGVRVPASRAAAGSFSYSTSGPDAKALTAALGGRWFGGYGSAPCPVCQLERRRDQTALTISTGQGGRLLAHCKRLGCDFRDIMAAAGLAPDRHDWRPDLAAMERREREAHDLAARKAAMAARIWAEAGPVAGTLAERYLRSRGIVCDLPDTLRFHGACHHGPTGQRLPAMLALVEGGDSAAVHRTWLAPDGAGKAAVEPAKAMLGSTAGGAVRLSGPCSRLVVCEGLETGLSLLCGLLEGPAAVWAALSTSGMRALRLPEKPERLTVAVDGDPAGRAAGYALAERAHAAGWQVGMIDPGDGRDWNDILELEGAQ